MMAPASPNLRRRAYWQGHVAEIIAAMLLRLKGWQILARRWQSGQGEVDLIARRGRVVIFVEVKYRKTLAQGREAISETQWRRIEAAADIFMARQPALRHCSWRFDAICVTAFWRPHHFQDMRR